MIETGDAVTLAHVLDPAEADREGRGSVLQRYMIWTGEGQAPRDASASEGATGVRRMHGSREYVGYVGHGSNTHLDAPSHAMWDGRMYNGFPASAVTAEHGATKLSVHQVELGVFTRGVLLDIPAAKGVEYLEPGYPVTRADLEQAESRQNVAVSEGDALITYTGHNEHAAAKGRIQDVCSGYAPECLTWFRERDVALIASDTVNDVLPAVYEHPDLVAPIHAVALVTMGLWLVDYMSLKDLVAECARRSRWEFFFALLPLRIVGSTSSLVNPVAIF